MSLAHRERVLRAATSSFLARGYASSVDDIARRARVAKQTVYQHFASKDELFKAVAEELAKRVIVGLEGADVRESLLRFSLEYRRRALGADGIATNCGFLSLFQEELAAACGVPVATSALMQAPLIERLLPPGRRVGILTISAASLTPEHLAAAGVALDTPVVGTEGGREFSRALLGNELQLDVAQAEADILAAGEELVARRPEVGAVLLECTNMCPYAHALSERLGLPVFDMVSFVTWFHGGLVPRRWPAA